MDTERGCPKVSVVIPVYHVQESLLGRCLESIRKQTLTDIETVIVFDEAIAGYQDLINSFRQESLTIRCLEQEHKGVSAARNLGIQAAAGDWIAFVDADDWLEGRALERLIETGEREGADFVMGEHRMEYGSRFCSHVYLENGRIFMGEDKKQFEMDVLKPQTGAGFIWGKLFCRRFLQEHGLFLNESLWAAEDAEFMFRASCEAERIVYVTELCYHYWYNASSAVRRYQPDYASKYIRSMEALKRDLAERKEKAYCWEAFYSCVLYHLLLIAVNDTFHPQSALRGKEKTAAFRALIRQPIFQEALGHIHYGDFSLTRKVTLLCIRLHWYGGVRLIASVRHRQFKTYSKKQGQTTW